jgi:small subunit ribosomal protein S7
MPRRKAAVKREVLPDPLYGSDEVAKFINVLMRAGKKSIAEKIMYGALTILNDRVKKEDKDKGESGGEGEAGSATGSGSGGKTGKKAQHSFEKQEQALEPLKKALANVAPTVEVKSRRVGGATYQVPVEVPSRRATALAMRWLKEAAEKRSEKTMRQRLGAELYEALMGRGAAVKTRDDVHRMANANKAFAHYRW